MDLDIDRIISQRGAPVLVINNYKLNKHRMQNDGLVKWICREKSCPAKCFTEGNFKTRVNLNLKRFFLIKKKFTYVWSGIFL